MGISGPGVSSYAYVGVSGPGVSYGSGVSDLLPSLDLNFISSNVLDSRITFTRATKAWYFNSAGVLTQADDNQARFDYNPSTLAPRGLLIEEARTNSIRNNTMQGAVAGTPGTMPTNWSTNVGGLSREIVAIGTQNGINYIDIKYSGTTTTTSSTLVFFEGNNVVAALNGQTWTGSCWVAIVGGSFANLTLANVLTRFNDASGVFLSSNSLSFSGATSSLNRYSIASTASNASTAFVTTTLAVSHANGAAIDITLRIGLPQLELGAFATSVIPTTTTALTRNADVASMTGTNFSAWFNAVEGTLFVQYQVTAGTNQRAVAVSDGTLDNVMNILVTNASGNGSSFGVTTAGSLVASVPANLATQSATLYKVAGAYKVNDVNGARNGTVGTTDTSAAIPVVDRANIGSGGIGSQFLNGHIQRIAYYPTRLPNATLQALTA